MNRHEKHLRDLCLIAEDLSGDSNAIRAKIAASIVLNNKMVAVGTNSYKTHPLQKKYSKNVHAIWVHSEILAIANALKRLSLEELSNTTLYIARMKYSSESSKKPDRWGMAKPCIGCQRAAVAFGIKKVYYTTDEDGKYEAL